MNLTQYRLKTAAQNRSRLWLCLATAGMLHSGAIALTHPVISSNPSPDPIQFFAVDQPDSLPASSNVLAHSASRSTQTTPQGVSIFDGMTRSPSSISAPQTKPSSQGISTPKSAAKDEIWSAYLAALRQQIYQQWQAQLQVKHARPTKVRFVVDRQGCLTDLELIQPSGDATADQDALKAVQAAAPFARLPIASKEERLRVTFNFEPLVFPQ